MFWMISLSSTGRSAFGCALVPMVYSWQRADAKRRAITKKSDLMILILERGTTNKRQIGFNEHNYTYLYTTIRTDQAKHSGFQVSKMSSLWSLTYAQEVIIKPRSPKHHSQVHPTAVALILLHRSIQHRSDEQE